MTASQQRAVDAIERDRREKEQELLLLLLLIFGTASRYATDAIRLGHDPSWAASSVIIGNARLGLPGMIDPTSRLLAAAHEQGERRTYLLADEPVPFERGSIAANVLPTYQQAVTRYAGEMARTLTDRIGEAMADAPDLNAKQMAAAVAKTLADEGYGKDDPYLLETCTERMVIGAHGGGMWSGWQDREGLLGFEHVSVLDDGTTAICTVRAGFSRPKDDPYWLTNWPALHWGCRSVPTPVFREREWSTDYPTIPPAPGFGLAPLIFTKVA